ncbi:MAG: peroxiredoxin [candidate division Zixibacteria bacterium]|nr:peroxiredoxin [candidate division Zixibacteria bacterium]
MFRLITFSVAILLLIAALPGAGQDNSKKEVNMNTAPNLGDKAVDFTLPYATRDSLVSEGLKLSGLYGNGAVVLAFYPADWSGGCTKEMCSFRDNFSQLQELNARIVAISGDYVYSHHQWAKHHDLPFMLASDYGGKLAKQYESWSDEYGMCKRTVFVIDNQGKIVYRNLQYSVKEDKDFNALKEALAKLNQPAGKK